MLNAKTIISVTFFDFHCMEYFFRTCQKYLTSEVLPSQMSKPPQLGVFDMEE